MNDSLSQQTQFLKLVGKSIRVAVRDAPTSQGKVLTYLFPDSVVEVKVMNSKGFYRLADGLVSIGDIAYF